MHKKNRISIAVARSLGFYEGESEGEPAPTNQGTPPVVNQTPVTKIPPPVKTFTQDEVNRLNQDERKKWQEKNRELVQSLEQLQQNEKLTQQQRDELATQIEQLKTTYQTEKETKELEINKLQKKYDEDTQNLKKTSESWKTRFETEMKRTAIANASAKHRAIRHVQIEALLLPKTKVVEKMNESGRPSGEFEPRVTFLGRDKDDKPVELDLSVDDAVKAMREMPDEYGNLFEGIATGGLGGSNVPGLNGGRLPNLENMSPQDYAKHRPEIKKQMALSK